MEFEFFMPMDPPTATAQERQVRIIRGKPIFYEPTSVKSARAILISSLRDHKPEEPIMGPIQLNVWWRFPRGKSHKDMEWRITKPDTDNLQKLLKDCMTAVGFWKDDAQVCSETVGKVWVDSLPGIAVGIYTLPLKVHDPEEGDEYDTERTD